MKVEASTPHPRFTPVTISITCESPEELAALVCRANVDVYVCRQAAPSGLKLNGADGADIKLTGALWIVVSAEAVKAGIYRQS